MKHSNSFRLFLLLCMLSTFFQCHKNKCKDRKYIPIDADVNSYFNYNPGSFWVYILNANQSTDTVTIANKEITESKCTNMIGFDYTQIKYTLSSSGNNVKTFYTIMPYRIPFIKYEKYSCTVSNENSFSQDQYFTFFSNSEPGSTFDGYSQSPLLYKEHLDSLIVKSTYYRDVKVFENKVLVGNSRNTQDSLTYWAKGIGVVKRELFGGWVWRLDSYSIK